VTWIPYEGGHGGIPILVGDKIVTTGGYAAGGPGAIYISTMATDGTDSGDTETLADGPQSLTNPISDGSNVYVAYRDEYPRNWLSYWTISGLVFNANQHAQANPFNGLTLCDDGIAMALGSGIAGFSSSAPGVNTYTLPNSDLSGGADDSFSSPFSFGIFDGTYVWSVVLSTDTLYRITPNPIGGATFTMPDTVSNNDQIAFDGTYVYLSLDGGGIYVFDVTTHTGTTHGSTVTTHCWYSANLGKIVVADSSANIYTMPLGGGALTLIGNADTILSDSGSGVQGFCDGPGDHDLWATFANGTDRWNAVYTPDVASNKIVMVIS
jgi:hypothetical protein